jgi:hypothetical protein
LGDNFCCCAQKVAPKGIFAEKKIQTSPGNEKQKQTKILVYDFAL